VDGRRNRRKFFLLGSGFDERPALAIIEQASRYAVWKRPLANSSCASSHEKNGSVV